MRPDVEQDLPEDLCFCVSVLHESLLCFICNCILLFTDLNLLFGKATPQRPSPNPEENAHIPVKYTSLLISSQPWN